MYRVVMVLIVMVVVAVCVPGSVGCGSYDGVSVGVNCCVGQF